MHTEKAKDLFLGLAYNDSACTFGSVCSNRVPNPKRINDRIDIVTWSSS